MEDEELGKNHPDFPSSAWLASGSSVVTPHTQKKYPGFSELPKTA